MKKINTTDSIRQPIITEKATILSEQNKTVFKVHSGANKYSIKKNTDKQLHILSDVKKEVKKTKDFNRFLLSNKLSNALIVSDKDSEKNFVRSAKNIKNIKVISDEGTNIYDLLKYTNIIITSTSMKKIETRLLDEKN